MADDLYTQHKQFQSVKDALSRAEGAYSQSILNLKTEFQLESIEAGEKETAKINTELALLTPQLEETIKEWETLTDWKAL